MDPAALIEAELFGHERGAFTGAKRRRAGVFEQAGSGILFLDEIGDMPLALQSRLLRVVQTRQLTRIGGSEPLAVLARLVCATHRDLAELVRAGEQVGGFRAQAAASERAAITAALAGRDYHITATAAHLGISRKTLWQKMKRLGIRRP